MEKNKLKRRPSNRRRKLALYTKEPFSITKEHQKAFLLAVDEIIIGQVTYKLTLDRTSVQRVSFGGRSADLNSDRTVNPNVFENNTPIAAPITNGMLWVVVRGTGKFSIGGGWELKVFVNGTAIPDSPIEEEVQNNNRVDHDDLHSIR
ncbi:hypothetical protein P1X15_26295 [Runella sp. MFBS21]|uniref:hypothetical protein n=1 Tax=Runella sp. MFBS21 TaxID=3034018 RepID=UPI0023F96464|nr:hypothetical protein [Runella sp. MFBS21]MDF7821161.1 hypothetical protein [Runella sp. MFBS21]